MPVIIYKRQFIIGVVLLIAFFVTLAVILSPVFDGKTGLQMADGLFNSLSKESSYYIPDVAKKAEGFTGSRLEVALQLGSREELEKTQRLFAAAGAEVKAGGTELTVRGDLGKIAKSALADAEAVFKEREDEVEARYGFPGKEAVYCWWAAFKQIEKDYLVGGKNAEALFIKKLNSRALEPAYNYSGIPPARSSEHAGLTAGMLIFYLIYTVWYGFAVLMIFEGLGITASKPAEKAEA